MKFTKTERRRRAKQARLSNRYRKKQKQIILEGNEEYQVLLKEYKKSRREIINRTKIKLEEILLNAYLFSSNPIKPKNRTAFDYFYDLGAIKRASTIYFGGLKISRKYFYNIMK